MTKKTWIGICILETLIIGMLLGLMFHPNTPIKQSEVVVKEIVRDSIIRDSIFIVNERIKKEIVYVKEQYKKDSVDIMSASDSVLLSSFSRYIEDYHNQ